MSSRSGFEDDLDAPAAPVNSNSPVEAAAARAPRVNRPEGPVDPVTLFHHAQLGDRSAFAQIVRLYQDRIYNSILRTVGDVEDARELTQETFTQALDKIDSFRGDAQPYTWIFRIGLNLAISRLRQQRRQRTFTLGDGKSGGEHRSDQAAALVDRIAGNASHDPAQIVEQREQGEQVLAALGRVEPELRALLVMRDIEGFDYQQMAALLGVPLGTLKSRLFRARAALLNELQHYFAEPKK